MPALYLVHLDRTHLGDPTFVQSLAQAYSRATPGDPASLIVHGSGEKLERTLEAQGVFPERVDGVLQVETDAQRRLAERAVREVNQELVGTLTDEVVSTVGVQGVDRSLLRRDADGSVVSGTVGWLEALLKQRVLPVVSALAPDAAPNAAPDAASGDGRATVVEIPTHEAVRALADGLSDAFDPVAVVFTTSGRPGIVPDAEPLDVAGPDAVTDADVAAPDDVRRLVDTGLPVLVTNVKGFFADDGPSGTRVER